MPESRPTSSVKDSRDSPRPVAPSGERCSSRISARIRSEVSCWSPDLIELQLEILEVLLVEHLARDVDLERKSEEDLGQVVVEVAGDREPLVRPLLRHLVGQLAQDLLTLLELNVRLFECMRS